MNQPKRKKLTPEKLSHESVLKKKRAQKKEPKKPLSVDIRTTRKDYKGLIDIIKRKLPDAPKIPMPYEIKPMLATLINEPFNDNEWQFELKLDGYRTLAYLNKGKVELKSRNNNSFNKKFESIYDALKHWQINAVVDGEIVVLNEDGVPDFNNIQNWDTVQEGNLIYYVFDLLWLDELNIMAIPLFKRREILKQLVPDNGIIRFSDHIDDIGIDFFNLTRENKLEGIIAKNKNSLYIPDSRTRTWLKIKTEQRHEAVICGYTKKKNSDRPFSSLVLGTYKNNSLTYLGQAGTGFSAAVQKELMKQFKPLVINSCPFSKIPALDSPVNWMDPHLICEVKYAELTKEGIMRHASFQGLRVDKTGRELNTESDEPIQKILNKQEEELKNELIKGTDEQVTKEVDGSVLKFTNLNKYYWPKERITKGSLINYYNSIADHMLPYMKDRPQSLNRFPDGINGQSFYHKNVNGKVDQWVKTFSRISENGESKDFLICTNKASLLYMANLGCIEMNPWHSRIQRPHNPDWCVIDLDPGNISFNKVIETALVVKTVLDSLHVPSFPKTSGSTGIHIYIPLGAKYNYEQSKQLAELIVNMVHDELPSFTSITRDPKKRTDKIYLDYLQNRPIQTICAPYSVRPKKGATVSAPLHWDEVKSGLSMSDFTIKNIFERVKIEGDLFAGVLGKGIDLNKIVQGLANLI